MQTEYIYPELLFCAGPSVFLEAQDFEAPPEDYRAIDASNLTIHQAAVTEVPPSIPFLPQSNRSCMVLAKYSRLYKIGVFKDSDLVLQTV
jgi:hypothetical protein